MSRNTILGTLVALAFGALGTWLGVDLGAIEDALFVDNQAQAENVATSSSADADADFDFYLLALSWSPTFCSDSGGRSQQQCGPGKRYGFITHGLWPQYERGYPESCQTGQRRDVSSSIQDQMLDIMPDRGLIGHQWRKHGTCSGLSQRDYFNKVRAATRSITVPKQFRTPDRERRLSARDMENAFAAANPDLDFNKMAIRCDRGRVREVRICLTKALEPRVCREVDARGCQQQNLRLPVPK
ncbi:MAG: ribonuclease T2 [Pseudomonadota bacterium]